MATNTEYEALILTHQWEDLLSLWEAIKRRDTPDWNAGKALEYLILRAFQLEDAEVRYPFNVYVSGTQLEQIDGVVYSDALSCMIECKDSDKAENIEPISKLRNQLARRPPQTIGLVFSRSGFTDAAITLAQYVSLQTILLWNGDEIEFALQHRVMRMGLLAKFRACVETGLVDHDFRGLSV